MDTDSYQISKVADHLYLSGIFPLSIQSELIQKLNIKNIICCVPRPWVELVHNRIVKDNPYLTILYLPYDDTIYQSLWQRNNNLIQVQQYYHSEDNYQQLAEAMKLYDNKPMIEIGYHFLDKVISQNENVLVHCFAGVSRSASLVIYYFMRKYGWTFDQAFQYVKLKRSIINPNEGFQKQLQLYQIRRDQFRDQDAESVILAMEQKSSV